MPTPPFTSAQIRQSFINHFAGKGHTIVPSSSLVPDNDPTLMFANSGMVQFKNNFTGADTRLQRAVSSQRCVRAGGKHNDLENIGHTARHHTFFEMLGNFSFGDYFKEEAITWAWQWLTEELKLDPKRMCVTIYQDDDEAFEIWNKKIGIAADDIIRLGDKSNFWTMGDTGPCGPSSEIFYDLDPTGKVWGGRPGTPEEDGDRWMEIWNLVFTQFDLQADGTRVPLKNKNIDTGAGLERVMAAVQGVFSNYETDVFQAIIKSAASQVGTTYGRSAEADISLRVIADHLRAMSFLMIDGVLPGNEGRGYVLRRIMRRAMRHGHLLGMEKPFIYSLVPTLVGVMGEAYPELQRGAAMVADVIKAEEERFGKALKNGIQELEDELNLRVQKALEDLHDDLDSRTRAAFAAEHPDQTVKVIDEIRIANASSQLQINKMNKLERGSLIKKVFKKLPGEVAFKLYDTYGFPLDLTEDALKEYGLEVDLEGFNTAMAAQKARARAAYKGSGDTKLAELWFTVQAQVGNTEFLGYATTQAEGQVLALAANGASVQMLNHGESGMLITNQTPFYAESGGQVGDTGIMRNENCELTVTDTQKVLDSLWLHSVTVTKGAVAVGSNLELVVDESRRAAITRNHTATHILFAGLRQILGTHVVQRGSRQDDRLTRFDFSHPKALTAEETAALEDFVNTNIWANLPVVTRVVDKDTAVSSGATAQFGEKYGDEVRVVHIGTPDSVRMLTADLCGGTHVGQTGEIGLLRVLTESSVSAGVRRLEAVTHQAAWHEAQTDRQLVAELRQHFKTKREDVLARVLAAKTPAKAAGQGGWQPQLEALLGKLTPGQTVVVESCPGLSGADLQELAKDLKGRTPLEVCLLASTHEGRTSVVAAVSPARAAHVSAIQLVQAACAVLGGKGGGKPEFASGAGAGAEVAQALAAAQALLS